MFRFKSIMWRIIFLHVVAVAITAALLRFVLYWSLDSDVEKLQQDAMQSQADALARYLKPNSTGGWPPPWNGGWPGLSRALPMNGWSTG